MRSTIILLVLVATAFAGQVTPELEEILASARPGEMIPVIVHLKEQADLSLLDGATRAEKVEYLKAWANRTQAPLLEFLRQSVATDIKPFWLSNCIALKAKPDVVRDLNDRADVDYVTDDFVIRLDADTSPSPTRRDATDYYPCWNIERVWPEGFWDDGYTGAAIVVGNIDTGVDVAHPAFGRRWRAADGWFDAVNGRLTPYDDNGHGTHSMGTICGGDGLGPDTLDIGVAPGASFIAAKAHDRYGVSYAARLHACLNWYAGLGENAPDIISNSWGYYRTFAEFWGDCKNLRALGIIMVFSIGNEGASGASSDCCPGNFPLVIGVGATDSDDSVATFSSYGPAPNAPPWDSTAYWLRPDWNRIKPDICAPGVSIYSALPGGLYGYKTGTSMAAPHVAGCVALMLETKRNLSPANVYSILLDHAYRPPAYSPFPNNRYGWGLLDCAGAHDTLTSEPYSNDMAAVRLDIPVYASPGETIPVKLKVRNNGTNAQWNVRMGLTIQAMGSYYYSDEDTLTDTLASGDTATVTFLPFWVAPPPDSGTAFRVQAAVWLVGDAVGENDYLEGQVTLQPESVPFPFREDFESDWGYQGGPPFGWRIASGERPPDWTFDDWHREDLPNRWWWSAASAVIWAHGRGDRCDDTIISPRVDCFNADSTWLCYYHVFWDDSEYRPTDTAEVIVSADDGRTWNRLASYTSDQGGFVSHNVTGLAAHSRAVRLAFVFRGPHHGDQWLLDDVRLDSAPTEAQRWSPRAPLPLSPSGKKVKAGGALVAVEDTLIYALKGNNTRDFYVYDTRRDSWRYVDSFPVDPARPKKVKGGGSLCYDGSRYIYALKGANTREFWRYDTRRESLVWRRLPDVPGEKKVKEGAGLAYYDSAGVALVLCEKACKTNEWYAFDCNAGNWRSPLQPPDTSYPYRNSRFGKGSCLARIGPYVLASLHNRGWLSLEAYDPIRDSWHYAGGSHGNHLVPRGETRPGKGAAMASDEDIGVVYMVDGNGTQGFYVHWYATPVWPQRCLDTIPLWGTEGKKCKVKSGGALAVANRGKVYALKGGGTSELWVYTAPWMQADSGPVIQRDGPVFRNAQPKHEQRPMVAAPTICRGQVGLRYSLAGNDCVRMTVHDIAGRVVRRSSTRGRAGPSRVDADLTGLPVGVYVVRLESEGYQTSQKLVVVR